MPNEPIADAFVAIRADLSRFQHELALGVAKAVEKASERAVVNIRLDPKSTKAIQQAAAPNLVLPLRDRILKDLEGLAGDARISKVLGLSFSQLARDASGKFLKKGSPESKALQDSFRSTFDLSDVLDELSSRSGAQIQKHFSAMGIKGVDAINQALQQLEATGPQRASILAKVVGVSPGGAGDIAGAVKKEMSAVKVETDKFQASLQSASRTGSEFFSSTLDRFSAVTQGVTKGAVAASQRVTKQTFAALTPELQKQFAALKPIEQQVGKVANKYQQMKQVLRTTVFQTDEMGKSTGRLNIHLLEAVRRAGSTTAALIRLGSPRILARLVGFSLIVGRVGKDLVPVAKQLLNIAIGADTAGRFVSALGQQLDVVKKKFEEAGGGARGFLAALGPGLVLAKKAVSGLGLAIAGFITGIAFAGAGIAEFFKVLKPGVKLAIDTEVAYSDLAQVIANQGIAVEETLRAFDALNTKLSETTGFSRAQLAQGEAILLQFRGLGVELSQRLVPIVTDFARRFGRDIPEAARLIGLAVAEPENALERLRGTLALGDETQRLIKDLTDLGDTAGAQELLIQALNDQLEGAAVTFGTTFRGALAVMQQQLNNVKEQVGAAFLPALKRLVIGFKDFFVNLTKGFVSVLKASLVFEGLIQVMKFFGAAMDKAGGFARVLGVALGVVGEAAGYLLSIGVLPLIGFFAKLIGKGTDWDRALKDIADSTKDVAQKTKDLTSATEAYFDAADEATRAVVDHVKAQIDLEKTILDQTRVQEDLKKAEEEYQNVLHGFPANSEEAIEAQDDLTEARLKAQEAELDIIDAEADRKKSLEDQKEAYDELQKVLHGYAAGTREAEDATSELHDAQLQVEEDQLRLRKSALSLKEAQRDLAYTQKLAAVVAKAYGANSRFTQLANEKVEEATLKVDEAQFDQKKTHEDVRQNLIDLNRAQEDARNILQGYTRDSKEARDAQEKYDSATRKAGDAVRALESAQINSRQAQLEYKKQQEETRFILEGYPATHDKAIQATRGLQNAQFDARFAPHELTLAQLNLKKALEEMNVAAEKSIKLLERLRELESTPLAPGVTTSGPTSPGQLRQAGVHDVASSARLEGVVADHTGRMVGAIRSIFSDLAQLLFGSGFHAGGSFGGGQTAMVGERGPELVRFGSPGRVYSNKQLLELWRQMFLQAMQSSGGSGFHEWPPRKFSHDNWWGDKFQPGRGGYPTDFLRKSSRQRAQSITLDGRLVSRQLVKHVRSYDRSLR